MKRVCPNCNNYIKDSHLYFCLNCGFKLEDGLIRREHPFKPKILKFNSETIKAEKKKFDLKNIHLSKKLLIGFSFVFLAGLFSVIVIVFTMSKARKTPVEQAMQEESSPVVEPYPNSVDLDFAQSNMNLTKENYTKYIPYGNYFYVFGGNITDFYKEVFGEMDDGSILSGLDEFIEGKFILIGGKEGDVWHVTYVLYLKDKESADEDFEDVKKEGWYSKKIGDVLVVTQKEEMLVEVEDSSSGVSKNISHHPKFRMESTQIPSEGQLLYVNLDENQNPILDLIDVYDPPHNLIESIKSITAQNPTKFVIRNDRE